MKPIPLSSHVIRYFLIATGTVLLLFVLAAIALFVYARNDKCSFVFAGDQNYPIKEAVIDSTPYYLYFQITGFHDKVSTFVVYNQKPTFDCTGLPEQDAIGWLSGNDDGSFPEPPLQIPLGNTNKVLELRFSKDQDIDVLVNQAIRAKRDGEPIPAHVSESIEMAIREAEINGLSINNL